MRTLTNARPFFSLSKSGERIFDAFIGIHPLLHSAESMNRTLRDLRSLQGSALVIGGIAVIEHGYVRFTEDIDLLYKNRDAKILHRLAKHFDVVIQAESGWHQLEHKVTKIRVELIPEGALGQYGFLPFCDDVAGEAGFISLAGLLRLKLIAGRMKDEVDIVELYKRVPAKIESARPQLPAEFHARFDALIERAKREMGFDPYKNFQNRPYPVTESGSTRSPETDANCTASVPLASVETGRRDAGGTCTVDSETEGSYRPKRKKKNKR